LNLATAFDCSNSNHSGYSSLRHPERSEASMLPCSATFSA
jgi:hypothetical protein